MAILVEGYNHKKCWKLSFSEKTTFLRILQLYPSTKMAITPMFFEQIEKFQCLKLSTAQGPAHDTFRRHVARVMCPQTCLEVSQLFWAPLQNYFAILHSQESSWVQRMKKMNLIKDKISVLRLDILERQVQFELVDRWTYNHLWTYRATFQCKTYIKI